MKLGGWLVHPRQSRPEVQVAGATHRGLVRDSNEDALELLQGEGVPRWCVAAAGVFDGVGGLGHGKEASARAARCQAEFLAAASRRWFLLPGQGKMPGKMLGRLMQEIHRALKADVQRNPALRGMATTATVALLTRALPRVLWVAHVGDSPVFRLRAGGLERLTMDDSPVAGLVRDGLIGPEQARRHPQRHVITQALGHGGQVAPHVGVHTAAPGDRFLLCTDGLTNMVPPAGLQALLAAGAPGDVCGKLIAAANAAGGADNITVVVMVL
jgi:serine/threonine protein phosphatase PrpC